MALTCWLLDEAWCGIHYMPSPTITVQGNNAVINTDGVIAIGATSWTVVDGANNVVGTGTMSVSATTITVCSAGTWVGGGAAHPGYYTIYTNSGTNGVVVGNVIICTASSNLYVPNSAGDSQINLSAWLGSAPDRDFYDYPGNSAATLITTRAADEYFIGPQDTARPHKFWVTTNDSANSPTQAPTSAQWGALATSIAASYPGAYYECPTNEPDDGGWSIAAIITYWNACAAAILAADPTAHVMGYISAGVYNGESTLPALATFLAGTTSTLSAFTTHMENSHQNLSNIVMLRQYIGSIKTQFATSGFPNLDMWFTETGINGGNYSILQPRRDARQRTIIRFVMESYGFAKENCWDFPVWDLQGSTIPSYIVDESFAATNANIRAGGLALHVMAEALYGTTCNPTNYPAKLSFGPNQTLGDSLFAGLHYTATAHDVVVLATNGLESDTVTLHVSSTTGVYAWDGWGNTRTVTVSGNNITVAVDDLLTYIFLPASSTVTVVDTGSNVLTKLNDAANIAPLATSIVNESAVSIIGVVANNSFQENNSLITGTVAPYFDATVPGSITISHFWNNATGQIIQGVAIFTGQPAWQYFGCSLTAFTIIATIDGVPTTVYTYNCASAVSYAIPSASNGNSDDQCTRTTWWTGPFAWIIPLTLSGPVTALEVSITQTDYSGQPDLAAWQVLEEGYGYPEQQIYVAEIQVYQGPSKAANPQLIRSIL